MTVGVLGTRQGMVSVPGSGQRTFGLHLAWLLSFAVTNAFVTVLIATTGSLSGLWPLYIVSIVVASLGYHIAGAALSMALTIASIALLSYASGAGFAAFARILPGMAAYAVAAAVIGIQAQRSSRPVPAESQVMRDAETGALTPELLRDLLGTELRRAARYEWPASLAIIRIEDYPAFRQKFGRIKAEQLLARAYEVLLLNARETDVIGRWEEASFAIVLQLADAADARATSARLGESISSTPFEGDALEPVTHVGVAAGIATFPGDGRSVDDLAECALGRLSTVAAPPVAPKAGDDA